MAKDKKANNKNGKLIKIIINLISITIFCVSYFYIYKLYVNETDKTYKEAELVKAAIKERERKLLEEDEVKQLIAEAAEKKEAIIESFPVYIAEEDNYMFVEKLDEALDITISSVEMAKGVKYYETIIPATNSGESGMEAAAAASSPSSKSAGRGKTDGGDSSPDVVTAYYNTLSFNFVTSYEGFKDLTEYISNYPEHTVIDSVTISRDNMTRFLTGNIRLKRFFLSGTGRKYETPVIEGIDIGTDNIFGTE